MAINQKEALFKQYEDRGGILNQWYPYANVPADAWTPYDKRHIATVASGAAVTLSTSVGTDPSNGPPPNTMDITAAAGGSDNHREFFMRSDKNYEYSQITSWVYGGGTWADADNRTQQGHVHRFQKQNGRMRAFVAWHDMFIGLPTAINIGIWEIADTGTGAMNLHYVNKLLSLNVQPPMPVQIAARDAGGIVTAWVSGAHYLRAGEKVNMTLRDATNLTDDAVTTVAFGNFVQVNTGGGADTDMGPGIIYKTPGSPLSAFPYVFSSRLLPGDIFQAKLWRPWEPEVPWSSTTACVTYAAEGPTDPATGAAVGVAPTDYRPRGKGLSGIYAGHLHNSEIVRFGLPDIREL